MIKFWTRSAAALALALLLPTFGIAQVDVSVSVAPPELPVYDQPPIPEDGYLWTPGYWAWGPDIQDYYWVPGTWVQAPQPEFLWTPGYWAVAGALFLWHAGYWGPQVGFYGGVNYGYGYGGNGYQGGYWRGGQLYYNRSVTNISNVNVTNVYNKTVVNNVTVNRVSYNGGNGVHAAPTPQQTAYAQQRHVEATPAQRQNVTAARSNPTLRVSQNRGHPPIAATSRPGVFTGGGVVAARAGGTMSVVHANQPSAPHPATAHPADGAHPGNLPAHAPPPPRGDSEQRYENQPHEGQAPAEPRPSAPPHPSAPPPPPHPSAPPPPPHPSAPPPPPHPAAPPHPERPPEHDHDHSAS